MDNAKSARILPYWAMLLALPLASCASLRDPQAVVRYESFGDKPKDAELFDLARSGRSAEDSPTTLALLKDLAWRLQDNVPVNREYQDRMIEVGQRAECLREYRERRLVHPSAANDYFLARLVPTPEEADYLLRQAVAGDPSFYWAHYARGIVLRDLGERGPAKKHLQRALDIHPDFAEGWGEMADFLEVEDLDAAKDALKRYTTLRPQEIRGRMNLGLLYLRLDRPKEARSQFEWVLRKQPNHKEALYALAAAELGSSDPIAARDLYRRIVEIDPQECLAHYNLGILFEQHLKSPESALREYETFQQLSAAREGEFLLRRLQVEKWIEDLRKTLGLPLSPANS